MDSAAQEAGEKRVRQMLIEPLERRGLARPTSLTVAQYAAMIDEVCAKLAYMDDMSLAALEEVAAAAAGGKERDRMPIGQRILELAAKIQPPPDDASPLIRAVFRHAIGRDALAAGWAPELLAHLRKPPRRWPTEFELKQVRERAADNARMMAEIERDLMSGRNVDPKALSWRDSRRAAEARIVEMVNAEAAE